MRRVLIAGVLSCATLLGTGCAEHRYRAAFDDLLYARPMQIDCWSRGTRDLGGQCEEEAPAANESLEACAATLARTHHSIVVERIRDELNTCMQEKGWHLVAEAYLYN